MDPPAAALAVFKYDHGDSLVSNRKVWFAWWSLFMILGVSVWLIGPFGIVPTIVAAVVLGFLWPKRRICLGVRYFVCGNTIAYYRNIERMALRPGNLTIFWGKHSFKLEEKRFPTNARKAHKISANKAAKFQKVSTKIIQRVLAESPGVQLVGIDRKGAMEVTQA